MNAAVVVDSYRAAGVPLAAGRILFSGPYVRGGVEVDLRRFIGEANGMAVGAAGGFVFEYDHEAKRLKVLQSAGRGPLEEVPSGTDLSGVTAHFLAWGAF